MALREKVFDPNPRVGKGSGWADAFLAATDIQAGFENRAEREREKFINRLALVQAVYGPDVTSWPDEIIQEAMKYGLFTTPGKERKIPRKPKKEVYTEEVKKELPAEPVKPTPGTPASSVRPDLLPRELAEKAMPRETTETVEREREVPQEPITVSTTEERRLPGGQTAYLPKSEDDTPVVAMAERLGMTLPPGVDPSLTMGDLSRAGMKFSDIAQGLPEASELAENLNTLYTTRTEALANPNPSVAVATEAAYSEAYRQFKAVYPNYPLPLPAPTPLDKLLEMHAEGFANYAYTPDQSMAIGLSLMDASMKYLQNLLAIDPDAALGMVLNIQRMKLEHPHNPAYSIIPDIQIEDMHVFDDQGNHVGVTPGFRTLVREANSRIVAGEMLELQRQQIALANAMRPGGGSGGGAGAPKLPKVPVEVRMLLDGGVDYYWQAKGGNVSGDPLMQQYSKLIFGSQPNIVVAGEAQARQKNMVLAFYSEGQISYGTAKAYLTAVDYAPEEADEILGKAPTSPEAEEFGVKEENL